LRQDTAAPPCKGKGQRIENIYLEQVQMLGTLLIFYIHGVILFCWHKINYIADNMPSIECVGESENDFPIVFISI
jgi:hypothetical protein